MPLPKENKGWGLPLPKENKEGPKRKSRWSSRQDPYPYPLLEEDKDKDKDKDKKIWVLTRVLVCSSRPAL